MSLKQVPKRKKPKAKVKPEVVPIYFPDAKIAKLKYDIEEVIANQAPGITYAAILGVLDMIKYETLQEWRGN